MLGKGKAQIHASGLGIGIHRRDLQVTECQSRARRTVVLSRHVLPAQRHLDQRVVRQRSRGIEPLDKHFERHVLVFVGGQTTCAHLREQLGNGRVTGQIEPQHQSIDEEPDQLIQCGVPATGYRESHGDIGISAELAQ
ncbi:Uncharacterised protein [Mycobacteroides abscessus subsp. bolletii]|nr:Uncharacterised protein [Mycobacteroides abscessus subsp. bolletii]